MIVLDLFCGEGGATRGYQRAGASTIGGDVRKSVAKWYPGPFVLGDWRRTLDMFAGSVDVVHASPPCPAYSRGTPPEKRQNHPRLIEPVREALIATGLPYVIENVYGARHDLRNPLLLCGSMFDLEATDTDGTRLRLERHRLFESNVLLTPPRHDRHDLSIPVAGVYGGGRTDRVEAREIRKGGYTPKSKTVRAALLGVGPDDMTGRGLADSIPPAYTEWIGLQLVDYLGAVA